MTNPHQLYKNGTILLWAGILVWIPYFALRMIGERPSLMVYLPFHLLGVIGGARMRTTAQKQLGKPVEKRRGYKRFAHYPVIASVLVWILYYALKLTGRPVELTPFLTVHLIGILSGLALMGIGGVVQYFQSKRGE
ncbi:MAG: hypothetical protein AB1345_10155 [Chloroflexota bacterium]